MTTIRAACARLAAVWFALLLATSCTTAPAEPQLVAAGEMIALDLMTPAQRYLGLAGGLVDNGTPTVTPVDDRIVIIAISMSNGFLEMNRFIELYRGHAEVSPRIGLVNCAKGGHALERWLSMPSLWQECRDKIAAAGFRTDQVRVVWAKDANQFTTHLRTLPDPNADYHDLVRNIAALSQRIGQEFPSVQAIFHSSRIYGGYTDNAARGEPIDYEGGFAVNAVIDQQKRGELPGAPWIGWGPYLWSNGSRPNGSGIFWVESDYNSDRVHPSTSGQTKVADALHRFFLRFDWYRRS